MEDIAMRKNRIMLTLVMLIGIVLFPSGSSRVYAEQTFSEEGKHPPFNVEEFRAKMKAYITQKAELTPAECEKVFPLFQEMKAKQRELKKQEMKLKRSEMPDGDKESQERLHKIAQLHVNAAKLEETYYRKMCKAISAKKVYAVILADDAFHREMLQSFAPHPRGKHRKKTP